MNALQQHDGSYDLRNFVRWITDEFEPAFRVGTRAGHYRREAGAATIELYGVSDMACVLHTIGRLQPTEAERADWAAAFLHFQDPETGYYIEKSPTHSKLHNTAFALAAMQLLDLSPRHPLAFAGDFASPRDYLRSLDWKAGVYPESHKGAGLGSAFALRPELAGDAAARTRWFDEYFATCDALFDPRNGMMGIDKPAAGDFDQVGGTFHYHFIYEHFNRRMPFPQQRIDAVLGLQQADGYWHESNRLWLTLDAMYLVTRTLRYSPHRTDDARAMVRRVMDRVMVDVFSEAGRRRTFSEGLAVHSLTCAINLAAEAQIYLGADEVITDWPLTSILDRRPFI